MARHPATNDCANHGCAFREAGTSTDKAGYHYSMDHMMPSPLASPGIDPRPFKEAPGRLVLEIAESALVGCLEPKPISSCYDDELPRVRKAIPRARHGRITRFRSNVNRKRFCWAVAATPRRLRRPPWVNH